MENYTSCKKYHCTLDNIKKKLDKYGIAIIPKLLNEKEINSFKNGAWKYFETITSNMETPIKRKNKDSWKTFYNLLPLHSMLMQHWGIGHAQFNWELRQNSKILEVFSKLWNVKKEELITSFDGSSFHIPPEITNRGWFKKEWLHCDQSFSNNNLDCYQSWVTAYPVNKGDGTLVVLEGSHKYHKVFADKFNLSENKVNWYKLTDNEVNYYTEELKCKKVKISCPEGSIVIWDSRTIHCGTEPLKERKIPNYRLVSYICMTPRKRANLKTLEKRIKAFEELRTCNHIPHEPVLFSKYPRTYGGPIPIVKEIKKPKLKKIGRKLVGY